MKYLLDLNVVSELRRAKPYGAVLAWLGTIDDKELHISALTVGEIQAGVEMARTQDSRKADEIESWLDRIVLAFDIVPMDGPCFRRWAALMRGHGAEDVEDAMIAATADVNDLVVVTRNTEDFRSFGVHTLDPFLRR